MASTTKNPMRARNVAEERIVAAWLSSNPYAYNYRTIGFYVIEPLKLTLFQAVQKVPNRLMTPYTLSAYILVWKLYSHVYLNHYWAWKLKTLYTVMYKLLNTRTNWKWEETSLWVAVGFKWKSIHQLCKHALCLRLNSATALVLCNIT